MMFSFTLIKDPVPLDYPFSCVAGRAHTILIYTGLHTLPLILLAEHRGCSLARNPQSVLSLIWYYCQPVPGNTMTHYALTGGRGQGDPVLLLRKWSTFIPPAAAHWWRRPKQTVTQHDEHCWNLWHSSSLGLLPCKSQIDKDGPLFPFSSIPLLLLNTPVINPGTLEGRHFKWWDQKNWKLS